MKKLSSEEQWRLDTDDRYLVQLIFEELSKRSGLDESEIGREPEAENKPKSASFPLLKGF